MDTPSKDFSFKPLNKDINWTKITNITDVSLLERKEIVNLSKEISTGYIPFIQNDSNFDKAIKLEQYGLQYLTHCCDVLAERIQKVKHMTKTLSNEEEQLDLKLIKLK